MKLEDMDMKRTNENLFRHSHHMKRTDQLQSSKDSLSKVLDKKQNNYITHLYSTNYFKYELKYNRHRDSLKYIQDSIHKQTAPDSLKVILDIDSLYKTLDYKAQERIMLAALENAKSTQKYIKVSQDEFFSRKKIINKHDIAWHEKFTMAFACLIFFFIGAPLGAIIRKGGFGLPFLVSITFFILYYVVSLMGRKFVEENVMVAWQGMWISSLLTLPLGVLFTYKATTDSVLFDVGAYIDFIKRPFKVFEIQYRDPEIVFHKEIKLVSDIDILKQIQELRSFSHSQLKLVEDIRKSWSTLYKYHFKQDTSKLSDFITKYNSLYAMLAVRFRNQKILAVSLSKFPKMDLDLYTLTDSKRKANYIFLTIGIFPLGLLTIWRSYLKIGVLKQKIEMIEKELITFEQILTNN